MESLAILLPAIAALAFISAFTIVPSAILAEVTTPLSIVKVSPPLLTVISTLSPSSIPPPPDISATEPLSFYVNNLPESVLMAISPTIKSLALGSLPLPVLSLIVFAIGSPPYKLILVGTPINIKTTC